MGTESLLTAYLTKTRQTENPAERSEVVQRIEAIFTELALPYRCDDEFWVIDSNVGEVMAGLDEDEEVLSFWTIMFTLDKRPKKNVDVFYEMLRLNSGTTGACFAITSAGGVEYAYVVARIAARSIDPPEVALALSSVFELASAGEV